MLFKPMIYDESAATEFLCKSQEAQLAFCGFMSSRSYTLSCVNICWFFKNVVVERLTSRNLTI